MASNTIFLNVQTNADDATKDLNKIDDGVDKIKGSTRELSEETKKTGINWTELSSKINVFKEAFGAIKDTFAKFHEIQMKGRKENLQWESMMNSTRADEISENFKKIDKAFGDNIDKASKLRMAYSSGFSDIKYDAEAFSNIVQNMSQRTGKEIGEVAEELQQMLLKGDNGILEDMGLLHNAELEMQKYAGSIGKAVDELTDFEIRQGKANINMKYLNTEFNNTKPLQDSYIDLTNKAAHATDGFAKRISSLTDNVFQLNSGMGNLSIKSQIEKTRKEIEEAEKSLKNKTTVSSGIGDFGSDSFYGAGLETIADEKDIKETEERLRKANSKLLALQSEAGKILSGRMINEYGIRKAETKKELQAIMSTIKSDIDTAQEQMKGFIANGKFIMNDEALKLMSEVEALKTVYGVAQKELTALGNIKQKAVGGKVETTKSEGILKAMGITGELSKEQEASIMNAMSTLNKIQGISNDEANSQFQKDIQRIKDEGNERLALALEQLEKENQLFDLKQKEKMVLQKKAKEEELRIDQMQYAVLQSAANSVYNDLISGQEDFLQRAAAVALQTAGSQIFADGIKNVWLGGGQILATGGLKGWETVAYGVAEMGAGVALGYAGNQVMPDTASNEGSSATEQNKTEQNSYTFNVTASLYGTKKEAQKGLNEVMR